jgi:hypothetical protein
VFQQKRKVFDIKEQRKVEGVDQMQSYGAKPLNKKSKIPAKPAQTASSKPNAGMPKWKL